MTYRLRNLGLALALAAVAVLLVFYYVSQERGRLQEDQELVPVWVASKDIPVGTSGAELDAGGFLTQSEVERGQVSPARSSTRPTSRPRSSSTRSTRASR